jgi:hypothetical protein
LEALAILYSFLKRYDKSLSMYLKLKHKRRLRTSSGVRSRQKSLFGGVGHTLQFPETLRQKLVNVPQTETQRRLHVDPET